MENLIEVLTGNYDGLDEGAVGRLDEADIPATRLLRGADLDRAKGALKAGHPVVREVREALGVMAEAFLGEAPPGITQEEFVEGLLALSLCGYLEPDCDNRWLPVAADMVRSWIQCPESCRPPHLRFFQPGPGANEVTPVSPEELASLISLCEAIVLLEHTGVLENPEIAECRYSMQRILGRLASVDPIPLENSDSTASAVSYYARLLFLADFCGEQDRVTLEIVESEGFSRLPRCAAETDWLEKWIGSLHEGEKSIEASATIRRLLEDQFSRSRWQILACPVLLNEAATRIRTELRLARAGRKIEKNFETRLEDLKMLREQQALVRNLVEVSSKAAELKANLDEETRRFKRENKQLRKAIRSAVEWQERSWAKRAFHRWRPPSEGLKGATSIPAIESPVSSHSEPDKPYRRAEWLRIRLTELGLRERALADLREMATQDEDPKASLAAAWELAIWFANQDGAGAAGESLNWLKGVLDSETKPEKLRRADVLAAECEARTEKLSAAQERIVRALEREPEHPDLLLASANLESGAGDQGVDSRLCLINRVLANYGHGGVILEEGEAALMDRLCPAPDAPPAAAAKDDQPLVTVILTAFNAEATLPTALRCLASQSWQNLEVLVVDDCSSDSTPRIIENFVRDDARFRCLRTPVNSGTYFARNVALEQATGEFVTCHDADDWSHPAKIECQVRHLLDTPGAVSSTSQQSRAFGNLVFHRRGNPGFYLFPNYSSLLFRRKPVLEKIGFWDSVRFGADSEFIRRLRIEFGEDSVVDLVTGPLCFQRQGRGSLTSDSYHGFHGFPMGARRDYCDAQADYCERGGTLRYPFPASPRPFAAPFPMLPESGQWRGLRHLLDAVIAGDLREGSPALPLMLRQLKIQHERGFRTGLIQMSSYGGNPHARIAPDIRDLIDGERVRMLVFGEKISCDLLLIHGLSALEYRQEYLPEVVAGEIHGMLPENAPDACAEKLERCSQNIEAMFGGRPLWHVVTWPDRKKWNTALADGAETASLLAPGIWRMEEGHVKEFSEIRSRVAEKQPLLSAADESRKPASVDPLTEVQEEGTFALYRIIGNDLVPRHASGQSRTNLEFILKREPEFEGCEKRWVINRIIDPEEERRIIGLLERYNQQYIHIPFAADEFLKMPWDFSGMEDPSYFVREKFAALDEFTRLRVMQRVYRHKNNYLMHNNGARNAALREGRTLARWVCPWDGNCFLTDKAWQEIRVLAAESGESKYLVVHMARITDNQQLLDPEFSPPAQEEPQLIFRQDAIEEFDEDYYYGRRPKVELLWKIGVPGLWWKWMNDPWDLPRPDFSQETGAFTQGGWVARLNSGRKKLEANTTHALILRGVVRGGSILETLDHVERRFIGDILKKRRLLMFSEATLDSLKELQSHPLKASLKASADSALDREPPSVMQKSSCAPSGDPHDYWHPAPYWWPDPAVPDGIPYIRKDGERVPGTVFDSPESAQYDRTRLQHLFDDTTALALGWRVFGQRRYAEHAASFVRAWFIDEETRMTPHLRYSQVRRGHNNDQGAHFGVIEFKDLYYFLDAVRILEADGFLPGRDVAAFREWLRAYRAWLLTSEQGVAERAHHNNHGTYFDLQRAAISAYLEDTEDLVTSIRDACSRVAVQFDCEGEQPDELSRTITAHYCCFNFQGWIGLARMAASIGADLWEYRGRDGQSLRGAAEWLIPQMETGDWPHPQLDAFDYQRVVPIMAAYGERFESLNKTASLDPARILEAPSRFYAHDGIMPFWQLGLTSLELR